MDTPSGIHFDPDGTVRFVTDTQAIRLRRPTFLEFCDLTDLATAADWQVMATATPLKALREKALTGTATETDVAEAQRITRFVHTAKVAVVEQIVAVLGDSEAPGPLPSWAGAGASDIVARLFAHWETVPFHGSGQNGT